MDDFLSNFVLKVDEKQLSDSKKDVLKFLKQIGVDSRFVSYIDDNGEVKLYIENLRFSKFSRKRTETFNKHYPDIEVVRSSLFQKISTRASKTLAESLKPKETILIPKLDNEYNKFLYILIEPYSRKYGIDFIEYDENLEYKGVSGVEFEQSSYNLYFKIYIDGSFYGVKLYIADPSLGLSNETFTLGGVDFSVEAVSGFTLNYMRIKNIMYDDSNGSHVCELVGLSLENAVYNDVPSNSKDATLMYYLRKKLDEFYTKTGTLTAGSTTITLTDSKLLTSSTFEIFTDTWGVNPTNVVVATGSITLTFEAQQNDVAVKVRWI